MTDQPDQTNQPGHVAQVHLNTVHRDIRVAAPGISLRSEPNTPGIGLAGRAAAALANRLARRGLTPRRWQSGAERILRRLALGAVTHTAYHRHQIVFRPRLTLALTAPPAQHRDPAARSGPALSANLAGDLNANFNAHLNAPSTTRSNLNPAVRRASPIELPIDRLQRTVSPAFLNVSRSRGTRLEPSDHPAFLAPSTYHVPPVPRTVVQSPPRQDQTSRPNGEAIWSTEFEAAPHLAPPALRIPPGSQVTGQITDQLTNALTDQVLDAIEQRLIAHRERMGRM